MKFILSLAILLITFSYNSANAQIMSVNPMVSVSNQASPNSGVRVFTGSMTSKSTHDTLSAQDTSYLYFYTRTTADLQIKYKQTKVSGYTRTKAKLQGTSDTTGDKAGTSKWYTLRGETSTCFGCSDSTFNLTNASGESTFIIRSNPLNYYRLQIINDTSAAGTSFGSATFYYKK